MSLELIIWYLRNIIKSEGERLWKGNLSDITVSELGNFIETDIAMDGENEYWVLSSNGRKLIALADKAGE